MDLRLIGSYYYKGETISILGSIEELAKAKEIIGEGYKIFAELEDEAGLWNYAKECGCTEAGGISKRLWKPCPFLEEVLQSLICL